MHPWRVLEAAPERILQAIPPASGAVVMGSGIVSIALSLDGHETLSRIVLVVSAAAWIVLGLVLIGRVLFERQRALHEAHSPAGLTGVAGTAVLGTRLAILGQSWAAIATLVVALGLWLCLLGPVLTHWATPTVGVSLVLTVSTESLAVLAATLAATKHVPWLADAALAPFVLGLGFYTFVIARFDLRQLATGRGDHWITGGALAISTLAAGRLTLAAHSLGAPTDASSLETVSLVLWALTLAWLPILVTVELLWPRVHYDVRRWSTVFPVGMYAACSFIVGTAARAPALTDFARVWVWVGVAVWLVALVAMLHRGLQVARGEHPTSSPERLGEVAPSQRRFDDGQP